MRKHGAYHERLSVSNGGQLRMKRDAECVLNYIEKKLR
jgi:hypothetical protein